MPWKATFVLVAGLFAWACSPMHIKLSPAANALRVTGQADVRECQFVAPITSRIGANFQSYEHNVEVATTDVRNKAASRGGTHLVLQPASASDKTAFGQRGCNNCVIVTGNAYRCD